MILFSCIIELDRFPIKKNSKQIFRNKWTGKPFIASNTKAQDLMAKLNAALLAEKLRHKDFKTIECDVNLTLQFYFPVKSFYTKTGKRSSKVADISNLYQSIEDGLQKVGIITNDSNVCSHDGSFRAAIDSTVHKLKIVITKKD
jgi:Holliday junction resolvase RusA-like endonuclease